MKDTVVVTAESSGAEVIPFIKVWAMLPTAILLTYVFTKLSNRYSQEKVFYIMISGFILFFALFAFVLYPLKDKLHPHDLARELESVLPPGFKGFIAMFHYWLFTAFYVLSELWGSIILTVIFWGFANEVTRIGEATRFYSIFQVGSNFAAIAAGSFAYLLTSGMLWEETLTILLTLVIFCGIASMLIFWWMNKNVLNAPDFEELHKAAKVIKTRKRLSLRESFTFLSNSKYLVYIAIIVVSYNLVIHLIEVIWKDQLRTLYPSPSDYNMYLNSQTAVIGVVSALTSFVLAGILGRFGWTRTALITPLVMLVTGFGFFTFFFFREQLNEVVINVIGTTPLALAVFFGAAQVCLSKAAKYSVFDATKEMAFIPLSHESKLKGKAAIDGVGSRLGKSGGSLIYQGLLMFFSTIGATSPFVAGIILTAIACWILATKKLGLLFNELVNNQESEEEPFLQEEVSQKNLVLEPAKG